MKRFWIRLFLIYAIFLGAATSLSRATRWTIIVPQNVADVKRLTLLGAGRVNDITWSPDGETLAIATANALYLHDSDNLERPRQRYSAAHLEQPDLSAQSDQHYAPITCIEFSPDSHQLAYISGVVHVLDLTTGQQISTGIGRGDSLTVEWNTPRYVVSTAGDVDIIGLAPRYELWDSVGGLATYNLPHENGRDTIPYHDAGVVLLSHDRTRLLAPQSDAPALALWDFEGYLHNHNRSPDDDVSAEATILLQDYDGALRDTDFSHDDRLVAAADMSNQIILWDTSDGSLVRQWLAHIQATARIAFSPDDRVLASAGWDGAVYLWDVATGEKLTGWRDFRTTLTALAYHPNGELLAVGGWDGRVWVVDTATGERTLVREVSNREAWDVDFNPDDLTLAVAMDSGDIWLWDMETFAEKAILRGHRGPVYGVSFSPDGVHLASVSADRTLLVWDTRSGTITRTIAGDDALYSVAYSPDGTLLASVTWDGIITLWNADTSQPVRQMVTNDEQARLFFSSDGDLLAYGDNMFNLNTGQVFSAGNPGQQRPQLDRYPHGYMVTCTSESGGNRYLWDIQNPRSVKAIYANTFYDGQITLAGCGVDPSHRLLVASSIIDMRTGNTIMSLVGLDYRYPDESTWDAIFNHEGSRIAIIIEGRGVEIWGLASPSTPYVKQLPNALRMG